MALSFNGFDAVFQSNASKLNIAPASAASLGNTGDRYTVKSRNIATAVEQTVSNSASLPSCLANSHGLLPSTYWFARSASAMILRMAFAEFASVVKSRDFAPAPPEICGDVLGQLRFAKFAAESLVDEPAARLAMLTYLPIKNRCSRAPENLGRELMSYAVIEFGGDVVAQPPGFKPTSM